MSNVTETVDITTLVRGDVVRITPKRNYGYEEEAGEQPWTAFVWDIDVKADTVAIVTNDPATITDPNPTTRFIQRDRRDGQDNALRVQQDGRWYQVRNDDPSVKLADEKAARKEEVDKALLLAIKVKKVSYGNRNQLCNELFDAIEKLA